MERFTEESESREVVISALKDIYGALAAALACLRSHLGGEVHVLLQRSQEPLWMAACAARSLDPSSADPLKLAPRRIKRKPRHNTDPFLPLHRCTLLTSISSIAEIQDSDFARSPQKSSLQSEANLDEQAILALIGLGEAKAQPQESPRDSEAAQIADWNVEFTASQLHAMEQAVRERQPKVDGALQLLQNGLGCYRALSESWDKSYSTECWLRATPADPRQHQELLGLVRRLRGFWQDAGAVLVPARQADLLALEKVRLKHGRLVHRAFRQGGLEQATFVLARLALVDEMLEEPQDRKLTQEVPFNVQKPYQSLEAVVRNLKHVAFEHRRRRRWLRCPHTLVHAVLAGEIRRQLLARFLTVETAFEPLSACESCPLSLRELRIGLCLMEIAGSERLASMIHEASQNADDDCTLRSLLELVDVYGVSGGGRQAKATAASAAASAVAKAASQRSSAGGKREPQKPPKAHMACKRCLAGEMPTFPHLSVQDLYRHLAASRGSGAAEGEEHEHGAGAEGAPSGSKDKGVAAKGKGKGKTASAARGSSGSSSDDGFGEDSQDEDDDRAIHEFGDDSVISWGSASLARSVLLCNEERSSYFKWLARVVLQAIHIEPEPSPVAEEQKIQTKTGRRQSFSSALSAAADSGPEKDSKCKGFSGLERFQAGINKMVAVQAISSKIAPPSVTLPGISIAASGRRASRLIGEAEKEALARVSERMRIEQAERDREDTEEREEAHRETTLVLPDAVVDSFRTDLDLPKTGVDSPLVLRTESSTSRVHAGLPKTGVDSPLAEDFGDRIARGGNSKLKLLKHRARLANVFVGLKVLHVPERDIENLRKELENAAKNLSLNPSGLMLVGGAAQAAQSMLVKGIGRPKSQSNATQTRDHAANSASAEVDKVPVKQLARSVIEASRLNSEKCYGGKAGVDPAADRVAVALRFLEHELFSAHAGDVAKLAVKDGKDEAGAPANHETDERVTDLAPMLLPRNAAQRMLEQLRREEAAAQALEAEASNKGERRRASILRASTLRVVLQDSVSDSDSSSTAALDEPDSLSRSCVFSPNSPPPSPKRPGSRLRPSSRLQMTSIKPDSSSDLERGSFPSLSGKPPESAAVQGAVELHVLTSAVPPSDWCAMDASLGFLHPSVRNLLNTVGARSNGMRDVVRKRPLQRSISACAARHSSLPTVTDGPAWRGGRFMREEPGAAARFGGLGHKSPQVSFYDSSYVGGFGRRCASTPMF